VQHNSYHDDRAWDGQRFFLGDITCIPKLTHLKLEFFEARYGDSQADCLAQLTAMSNLEKLELIEIPVGVPGGFPSQLVKLTHLHVSYCKFASDDQFQHLSSLTALQELSVDSCRMTNVTELSGIQQLTQLTNLRISASNINFDTNNTSNWSHLTALQSLTLNCYVQPAALVAFTQLKNLALHGVRPSQDTPPEELLPAVCGLTQLTELSFFTGRAWFLHPKPEAPSTADAFTALTASINLQTLKLGMGSSNGPYGCILFKPGTGYPHLTDINLQFAREYRGQPVVIRLDPVSIHTQLSNTAVSLSITQPVCITEQQLQQLQQLCSSCPAVKSLDTFLCLEASPTALLPLLQLSALTHLALFNIGPAAEAVVGVVGQLTSLEDLVLYDCQQVPALMPLTALTALEELELRSNHHADVKLKSEVSVWSVKCQ
jgi:hypothetical protein